MTLLPATREFARKMAIQHIGYWRTSTMPGSRKRNRQAALFFLHAYRTGAIQ